MDEYSRIIIEHYCYSHKSAKAQRLQKLVELAYDFGQKVQMVMLCGWRER